MDLALWPWPAGVDLLAGTNEEQLCHIVAAASFWQKGRGAGPGARTHRRGTITQLLGDPKQAEEPPSAARRGAETQGRWRPQEIQARRAEPHFLCVRKHPEVTWMLRTEVKCVGRPTRGWNDDRKRRKNRGQVASRGTRLHGVLQPQTPRAVAAVLIRCSCTQAREARDARVHQFHNFWKKT